MTRYAISMKCPVCGRRVSHHVVTGKFVHHKATIRDRSSWIVGWCNGSGGTAAELLAMRMTNGTGEKET